MSQALNRRAFLGRSLTAGAGMAAIAAGGSTFLAACGSDSSSSSSSDTTSASGAADLGTLDYQFSWIKNVEFAGQYIADQAGYYTDGGFSKVNFMAGGPTVQQDAVVAVGQGPRSASRLPGHHRPGDPQGRDRSRSSPCCSRRTPSA